jgi:HlyD family secretion protein
MKILKVCIILILLSLLGFIVYRSWNKNETTAYKTISLSKRDINEAIYIPGNVFPSKEIEIKSQLSGILDSIYVKIGDYVEAGAPVASIKLVPNASDTERLENNVNIARIDYREGRFPKIFPILCPQLQQGQLLIFLTKRELRLSNGIITIPVRQLR